MHRKGCESDIRREERNLNLMLSKLSAAQVGFPKTPQSAFWSRVLTICFLCVFAAMAAPRTLLQERGVSPVLREDGTGCFPTEDGVFGSQDGEQVNAFFFYQVEATPGTTETQLNGIILDDIEKALLKLLVPFFFSECVAASKTTKSHSGSYMGMSSKPADFVLRGCKWKC